MATEAAAAASVAENPALAKASRKAKTPGQKKPKAPKAAPAHPTYLQMSVEAIGSLKDRTGSSQQAIAKWAEEKYKGVLPENFRKLLSVQLKKLCQKGKLVQVKHSYKLSEELKKPAKPAKIPAEKKLVVTKAFKVPKSPKPARKTIKSGAPKIVKPSSVKVAKSSNEPVARPVVAEKKTVKKPVSGLAATKKKAASAAKKVTSIKKVPAPKKHKSAKQAAKPKLPSAKKPKPPSAKKATKPERPSAKKAAKLKAPLAKKGKVAAA